MRHARLVSQGLRLLLGGSVLCSTGCTHNYYYGTTVPAACPPGAMPATVTNGAVCEVPSQVSGGTVVAQGPTRSTVVVGGGSILTGSRPPRVVVSQPSEAPLGRWRRSNPDSSVATVSVDGNIDSPTTTR